MAVRCNVSSKRSNSVMGVQNCVHGPRAYKLGLVMGQHIDIIAIYRRHRYYRGFLCPTATRCSCYTRKVNAVNGGARVDIMFSLLCDQTTTHRVK